MGAVKLERRNYNSMDLCKFFMAIFVVAIHTHPLQYCSNDSLFKIYELTVQLAVPFFFFSTGFLLASRFDPCDSEANIRSVARYLRRITKMYFVWCFLSFPFSVYYYVTFRSGVPFLHIVASYIRCLLCIGGHYNAYQLWYLLSTIYGLVLVIVLLRCRASSKIWVVLLPPLCALSLFMDYLAACEGPLSTPLRIMKLVVRYTTVDGRVLWGCFLVPAGMLMAKRPVPSGKALLLFAVCTCLDYVIEATAVSVILTFLRSAGFFALVMHIDLRDRAVYPMLRMISTDMYLTHLYVWIIYSALMDGAKRYGFDSFAVTTACCILIGCIHFLHGRRKVTG